jgi:hypothetical protein
MNVNEQEKDQLERRLSEQELFRQVLAAKNERLAELEAEVRYLRRTLNDAMAAPRAALAARVSVGPAPSRTGFVPRRWRTAA